jgi:membrane protease YdiL (CAAX protease family)
MDGTPIVTGDGTARRAVFPPPARGWLLLATPILGVALAVGLVVVAQRGLLRWAASYNRYDDYFRIESWFKNLPQPQILFEIYVYAVLLAAMLLIIPKHGEQSIGHYLRRVRPIWLAGGVLIGIISAFGVIAAQVLLVQHHVVIFHASKAEQLLSPDSIVQLPLVLLLGAVCAPVVEELYFRGLLLGWLRRRMHILIASLISAAIFALTHGLYLTHPGLEGWIITGLIGLIGLVLPAMAIASQSLWPSMAVHGGYNGTLLVLPFVVRALSS